MFQSSSSSPGLLSVAIKMADSPSYVNVVRSKSKKVNNRGVGRPNRQSESHYYTSPDSQSKGEQSDGYQTVQERGRDPNGEYTDLAVNIPEEDQLTEATIAREKMINEILFPPKGGVRRFNYTDIQLTTKNELDNEQDDFSETNVTRQTRQKRARPLVMPKPDHVRTLPETKTLEDDDSYVEMSTIPQDGFHFWSNVCTGKCCMVLYLVLLVILFSISITALGIAIVTFTSQDCEKDFVFNNCMITSELDDGSWILHNNSCIVAIDFSDEVCFLCRIN